MCASGSVGWARRWDVVRRAGGVEDGGMARRSVVDVPRERIASPGLESETIDAGLSPVKGATPQSVIHREVNPLIKSAGNVHTGRETVSLYPPLTDWSKKRPTEDRFWAKFRAEGDSSASFEQSIVPFMCQDIHQIHPTCIRYFYRCNYTKKEGWNER
jgi:hypothetical protein